MERWRVAVNRIRGLFAKANKEKELDAELRAHLEMLTEENIRRGMSPEKHAMLRGANLAASSKQKKFTASSAAYRFLTRSCKTCASHCVYSQNLLGSRWLLCSHWPLESAQPPLCSALWIDFFSKPSLSPGRPLGQLWR